MHVRVHVHVHVVIAIFLTLLCQFEAGEWKEDASNPGWGTFDRADGKPSPFLSIFHSFYWVLVTMTTVGYGDMYPITAMGWVVAGAAMMSGCAAFFGPRPGPEPGPNPATATATATAMVHHPSIHPSIHPSLRPTPSPYIHTSISSPTPPLFTHPIHLSTHRRLIVLTLPITIIGANFDDESREQQRINERRRRAENRRAHARSLAEGWCANTGPSRRHTHGTPRALWGWGVP